MISSEVLYSTICVATLLDAVMSNIQQRQWRLQVHKKGSKNLVATEI